MEYINRNITARTTNLDVIHTGVSAHGKLRGGKAQCLPQLRFKLRLLLFGLLGLLLAGSLGLLCPNSTPTTNRGCSVDTGGYMPAR